MSETLTDLQEVTALYKGMRLTTEGKRIVVVRRCEKDSSFDAQKEKDWRSFRALTPGSVVTLKARLDEKGGITNMVYTSVRWVEPWTNEADRLTWAAEHEVASMDFERRRLAAKDVDALHDKLKDIRYIYQSAVGWRRAALLAEMVRYICS